MGDEEYPASVVGVDRDKDVAVLQLKMPEDVDMKVCSLIRKDLAGICQICAEKLMAQGMLAAQGALLSAEALCSLCQLRGLCAWPRAEWCLIS